MITEYSGRVWREAYDAEMEWEIQIQTMNAFYLIWSSSE